jgi:hypothetical protein
MTVKHTPGPWTVDEIDVGRTAHILGGVSNFCAEIVATVALEGQESQANARLIAAAPDLLEALRRALWCLDHEQYDQDDPYYGAINAAIAKATGAAE